MSQDKNEAAINAENNRVDANVDAYAKAQIDKNRFFTYESQDYFLNNAHIDPDSNIKFSSVANQSRGNAYICKIM